MIASSEPGNALSLNNLLEGFTECVLENDQKIKGISTDSRKTTHGDLFLACHGSYTSGVHYIDDAINAGANAVAVEADLDYESKNHVVPIISIEDLQHKAGIIAERFFGNPTKDLNVIGITGTNAKTSVSY